MGRPRIRSTSGRNSRATRRTKLPRVPSSRSRSSPVPPPPPPPPPPPGNPVARFTFNPSSPDVNAPVAFDASTSTSSNGALQVRWDWEDNAVWDTTLSATLTASHAYPSAGTNSVRLEVQDAGGLTGTTTHALTVVASGGGPPPPSPPGAPTTSASVDGAVGAN